MVVLCIVGFVFSACGRQASGEDAIAQCVDSLRSAMSNATEHGGPVFGCERWAQFPHACVYSHYYDDEEFSADGMCCACGGGTWPDATGKESQHTRRLQPAILAPSAAPAGPTTASRAAALAAVAISDHAADPTQAPSAIPTSASGTSLGSVTLTSTTETSTGTLTSTTDTSTETRTSTTDTSTATRTSTTDTSTETRTSTTATSTDETSATETSTGTLRGSTETTTATLASTTETSTETRTSTTETSTATFTTTATMTSTTTTTQQYVVQQALTFKSTGTKEAVANTTMLYLTREFEVEESDITIAVSEAEGRRLELASAWNVVFEVVADQQTALRSLEKAQDVAGDPGDMAADLAATFLAQGLDLNQTSLQATPPEMKVVTVTATSGTTVTTTESFTTVTATSGTTVTTTESFTTMHAPTAAPSAAPTASPTIVPTPGPTGICGRNRWDNCTAWSQDSESGALQGRSSLATACHGDFARVWCAATCCDYLVPGTECQDEAVLGTDQLGQGCAVYGDQPDACIFASHLDDSDFSASDVCCACEGIPPETFTLRAREGLSACLSGPNETGMMFESADADCHSFTYKGMQFISQSLAGLCLTLVNDESGVWGLMPCTYMDPSQNFTENAVGEWCATLDTLTECLQSAELPRLLRVSGAGHSSADGEYVLTRSMPGGLYASGFSPRSFHWQKADAQDTIIWTSRSHRWQWGLSVSGDDVYTMGGSAAVPSTFQKTYPEVANDSHDAGRWLPLPRLQVSCVGDASRWNAGLGACHTYAEGSANHALCATHAGSGGLLASQVCEECDVCFRDANGGDSRPFGIEVTHGGVAWSSTSLIFVVLFFACLTICLGGLVARRLSRNFRVAEKDNQLQHVMLGATGQPCRPALGKTRFSGRPSWSYFAQTRAFQGKQDFDNSGPRCRKCYGNMVWGDYVGPPYVEGWRCANFRKCGISIEARTHRWYCLHCQEDFCDCCWAASMEAMVRRCELSLCQADEARDDCKAARRVSLGSAGPGGVVEPEDCGCSSASTMPSTGRSSVHSRSIGGVSQSYSTQAQVVQDNQNVESLAPSCRKCHGSMAWSDYAGPPYQKGWQCANFLKCGISMDAQTHRWYCSCCHEDFCDRCWAASIEVMKRQCRPALRQESEAFHSVHGTLSKAASCSSVEVAGRAGPQAPVGCGGAHASPCRARLSGLSALTPVCTRSYSAQAQVLQDNQNVESLAPSCRKCHGSMAWSDYAGPPYQEGWQCANFRKCGVSTDSQTYRWYCSCCHEDFCDRCWAASIELAGRALEAQSHGAISTGVEPGALLVEMK